MGLVLLSIGIVGIIMLAMAVGPMISGRCLRGSCGGLQPGEAGDGEACESCPMRQSLPR